VYGWLAAGRCDVRRLGRDSGQETVLFGCRAPRGSLPSAVQNPTRLPAGARTTVLVYSVRLIYYYYYFSIYFFYGCEISKHTTPCAQVRIPIYV